MTVYKYLFTKGNQNLQLTSNHHSALLAICLYLPAHERSDLRPSQTWTRVGDSSLFCQPTIVSDSLWVTGQARVRERTSFGSNDNLSRFKLSKSAHEMRHKRTRGFRARKSENCRLLSALTLFWAGFYTLTSSRYRLCSEWLEITLMFQYDLILNM